MVNSNLVRLKKIKDTLFGIKLKVVGQIDWSIQKNFNAGDPIAKNIVRSRYYCKNAKKRDLVWSKVLKKNGNVHDKFQDNK